MLKINRKTSSYYTFSFTIMELKACKADHYALFNILEISIIAKYFCLAYIKKYHNFAHKNYFLRGYYILIEKRLIFCLLKFDLISVRRFTRKLYIRTSNVCTFCTSINEITCTHKCLYISHLDIGSRMKYSNDVDY